MNTGMLEKGEFLIPNVVSAQLSFRGALHSRKMDGSFAVGRRPVFDPPVPPDGIEREDLGNRIVIVDASNVAYVKGVPSLDNVRKVDEYLQSRGFNRDNIVFIFDASFRYKVDQDEFDAFVGNDPRVSVAPAKEQADAHILEYAYDSMSIYDEDMPVIISNDQYRDYFEKYPLLREVSRCRRGITWLMSRNGKLRPVICMIT